jgi:hypothetical protein
MMALPGLEFAGTTQSKRAEVSRAPQKRTRSAEVKVQVRFPDLRKQTTNGSCGVPLAMQRETASASGLNSSGHVASATATVPSADPHGYTMYEGKIDGSMVQSWQVQLVKPETLLWEGWTSKADPQQTTRFSSEASQAMKDFDDVVDSAMNGGGDDNWSQAASVAAAAQPSSTSTPLVLPHTAAVPVPAPSVTALKSTTYSDSPATTGQQRSRTIVASAAATPPSAVTTQAVQPASKPEISITTSGCRMPNWHRIQRYDNKSLLDQLKSIWEQLEERETQLQYVWDVYHRDVFKVKEHLFRERERFDILPHLLFAGLSLHMAYPPRPVSHAAQQLR